MSRQFKFAFVWGCILLFGICFLGMTKMDIMAKEPETSGYTRYYRSIRLEKGDNLWDLAQTYSDGSPVTVPEYIEEIKQINGLKDDKIHTGCYLTIVYFEADDTRSGGSF